MWQSLDIVVKKLSDKNNWTNLPSQRLEGSLDSRDAAIIDSVDKFPLNPPGGVSENDMSVAALKQSSQTAKPQLPPFKTESKHRPNSNSVFAKLKHAQPASRRSGRHSKRENMKAEKPGLFQMMNCGYSSIGTASVD